MEKESCYRCGRSVPTPMLIGLMCGRCDKIIGDVQADLRAELGE